MTTIITRKRPFESAKQQVLIQSTKTWKNQCDPDFDSTKIQCLPATYTYKLIDKTVDVKYPATTYNDLVYVDFSCIANAGFGLFANTTLKRGDVIALFDHGKYMSRTTFEATINYSEYAMSLRSSTTTTKKRKRIDDDEGIVVDEGEYRSLASFANHSFSKDHINACCEYNTIQQKFQLKATKTICMDQEIYYDYGDAFWEGFSHATIAYQTIERIKQQSTSTTSVSLSSTTTTTRRCHVCEKCHVTFVYVKDYMNHFKTCASK